LKIQTRNGSSLQASNRKNYSVDISANRLESMSDSPKDHEITHIQNSIIKEREMVEKMKNRETTRIDVNIGCV
jgi:hypothetical protein